MWCKNCFQQIYQFFTAFWIWSEHRELLFATSQSRGRAFSPPPNVWENPKILGGYRGKSKWWKSGRWKMKVVRIWIWGQRVTEKNDRDRVGRWFFESFEFVSDSESGDYIQIMFSSGRVIYTFRNLTWIPKMMVLAQALALVVTARRLHDLQCAQIVLAGKCTEIEHESDRVTGDCDPTAFHDTNHANQLAW